MKAELKTLLCVTVLLAFSAGTEGQTCPPTSTMVAFSDPTYESPDYYQFAVANLHIFPQLTVPCNGRISEWRVLVKTNVISNIHLAVFRPRDQGTILTLAGDSAINDFVVPNANSQGVWTTIKQNPPIAVKAGDYLGYFYDSLDIPLAQRSMLAKIDMQSSFPRAMVLKMNASQITANQLIDTRNAALNSLAPGIKAVVRRTPTGNPKPNAPRPTTRKTTPKVAPVVEITTTIAATTAPVQITTTTASPKTTVRTATRPAATKPPTAQAPQAQLQSLADKQNDQRTPARVVSNDDRVYIPVGSPIPFNSPDAVCDKGLTYNYLCYQVSSRYYYDRTTGHCTSFLGCSGNSNENNFDTAEECNDRCGPKTVPADRFPNNDRLWMPQIITQKPITFAQQPVVPAQQSPSTQQQQPAQPTNNFPDFQALPSVQQPAAGQPLFNFSFAPQQQQPVMLPQRSPANPPQQASQPTNNFPDFQLLPSVQQPAAGQPLFNIPQPQQQFNLQQPSKALNIPQNQQQTMNIPQQTFNMPQQAFNMPQQTFNMPQQTNMINYGQQPMSLPRPINTQPINMSSMQPMSMLPNPINLGQQQFNNRPQQQGLGIPFSNIVPSAYPYAQYAQPNSQQFVPWNFGRTDGQGSQFWPSTTNNQKQTAAEQPQQIIAGQPQQTNSNQFWPSLNRQAPSTQNGRDGQQQGLRGMWPELNNLLFQM